VAVSAKAGPAVSFLVKPLEILMFKINQQVRRNPKIWRNDKTIFTIVSIEGNRIMCQRPGKERNTFTGKLEAYAPMPYMKSELIAN
jgi:hypothetical protein